jgi:hypothetical protein
MARRWWKWLVAAMLVPLLVWGFDRIQFVTWVGSTDLKIAFVVVTGNAEQPVAGARIEVQSEGGFYEEREKQEFVLHTNTDGIAHKVCHSSMCFGARSGLGFTDTFAVHLPWWRFRVSAPGFSSSGWVDLDVSEFRRRARRSGPGKAELLVRISLREARD